MKFPPREREPETRQDAAPVMPVAPVAPAASVEAAPVVPAPAPLPRVVFHIDSTRATRNAASLAKIPMKAPSLNADGSITLYWNPRPQAGAQPADPQGIAIGSQNAPRSLYTGYGVTIPSGYRGVVHSVPEHGPVRPLLVLPAGKHDIDVVIPCSYSGSNVHGVQIGPQAAIGTLILERVIPADMEIV